MARTLPHQRDRTNTTAKEGHLPFLRKPVYSRGRPSDYRTITRLGEYRRFDLIPARRLPTFDLSSTVGGFGIGGNEATQ